MTYLETNTESSRAGKPARVATKKVRRSPNAKPAAVEFAAESEAAIAELESERPRGVGALERALAARVRSALEQLRGCAAQIEEDGLMVLGSTGQRRAHPLLKLSGDL